MKDLDHGEQQQQQKLLLKQTRKIICHIDGLFIHIIDIMQ